MDSSSLMLTVMVITYNQKEYILRALDSVLSQKTEYSYELCVYDDASTDGTASLLKDYKNNHQEVKLLLQDENQYSKGVEYILNTVKPYCKAKYMIFLEGDDFWCDDLKIQKQIDILETNPQYVATTHRCVVKRSLDNGHLECVGYYPANKTNNIWTIHEIIDWKDAPHSTSLMFRTDCLNGMEKVYKFPATDWATTVWLCVHGMIHYSNEIMSVHSTFNKGSYTERNFGEGIYKDYDGLLKRRQNWCNIIDEATGFKYHDEFQYSQERRWGEYLWQKGDYRLASKYKGYVRSKPIKKRFVLRMIAFIPGFENVYKRLIMS